MNKTFRDVPDWIDVESGLRWLLARSDVEAAMEFLDNDGTSFDDQPIRAYINKHWPHFFDDKSYESVYKVAGEIESKLDVYAAIPHTHRYQVILQAMQQIGRPKRVLDFGCSRAYHAIHLHNALGTQFVCADIDQISIDQANAMIRKAARYPAGMRAVVTDHVDQFVGENFDAIMCLETLEHVPNIDPLLERFEQCVKPGGWIVLTVPHGPVEFTMWVEHPERNREHIREIGLHDCYELWSHKPGFHLQLFAGGVNRYAGMTEGNIVIMYQADQKPVGKINYERKILGALACVGPELPE